MFRGGRQAVTLAVCGLAVAACGGAPGEAKGEKGVRDAVTAFARALVDDDPKAACDQLTDNAKRNAMATFHADTCEKAMERLAASLHDSTRKQAEDVPIAQVKIDGGNASVVFATKFIGEQDFDLKRVDGRWLLDDID
ncbi:hypothetical protein TH66_00600 [Carbonactinospora thermoautotrophica]|uniref:DUF4878 domain-containing protein n=1 Tax=Carbonactinospora thermoautotrophica TaxID=1469144 RepID=A0A132NDM1_9ACTN|nr:hypothetical protein TH66_00600 [Carbonactinospora thermoautotrophica]KWX08235.1 hypothetical protein TR74_15870 [Carbonactinospora thermoautotrophica]